MNRQNEVPVLLMAFIRPDLLKKSLDQLVKLAPSVMYVAIDGPRNEHEEGLVKKCRTLALNPEWDCQIIPLFRDENIGLVQSFLQGMNKMFSEHEFGIFLEDDVLLSPSFYKFAHELLIRYRDNNNVGHINASNFLPNFSPKNNRISYLFSNHPHVWGFATWKRMWESYDLNMPAWKMTDQKKLLNEHCFSNREKASLKHLFDLHCENNDPWACDYQWIFNCLNKKALSITPKENMSLNIGFERIDSTHTISSNPHANLLEECTFPLLHPNRVERDLDYDKALSHKLCPSHSSVIIGKIKNKFSKLLFGQK